MNKQAKVITTTLNPSLALTLVTHFLALGYHNRTTETTRVDPAGRGIGIARALHSLGVPSHAILLIGQDATGRAYQTLLAEEQFPISILHREGRTCNRIIIKDTGHKNETCVWEDGDGVTQHDLQTVAETLQELIDPGDTVVFAGSLPDGLPSDTYAWLTNVAQAKGARVIINVGGGEALQLSLKAGPNLVYLTQTQAEALFNFPVRTQEVVVHCAHELLHQGAKTVLIDMDQAHSAILATEQGVWAAEWTDEEAGTQSGREEALIAGYLAGRIEQFSRNDALELGAAAATYTASQVGHEFGTHKDAQEHADEVDVTPLEATDDEDNDRM